MGYFIQESVAQTASAAPQGAGLGSFVHLIILFLVFYIFLIRPQMKRQKEHAKMVRELSVGDEAVTTGGLLGKISVVDDNFVKLEVARDIEVSVQKQAISQVMPKGTYKGKA